MLQQGPTEQGILEKAYRSRIPIPKAIQNAPDLLPGLGLYYTAYLDLQSCRQVGLESGPISWLSVDEYAERCGYDQDQREDLHYYIKELDSVHTEYSKAKRDSTSNIPKK